MKIGLLAFMPPKLVKKTGTYKKKKRFFLYLIKKNEKSGQLMHKTILFYLLITVNCVVTVFHLIIY